MSPEQELELLPTLDDDELCRFIASKVRHERTRRRLSQTEFARAAGVPLRTYKRFEIDGLASLPTFLRVLRSIGRIRYLMTLFPQPMPESRPSLDQRVAALVARESEKGS
jgi:transcriptional regulator with XRE-family HTH domain